MKYKTKFKTIEAVKWNGSNCKELREFVGDLGKVDFEGPYVYAYAPGGPKFNTACIERIEGGIRRILRMEKGDYIVRNNSGSLDIYSDTVFEDQYEPCND